MVGVPGSGQERPGGLRLRRQGGGEGALHPPAQVRPRQHLLLERRLHPGLLLLRVPVAPIPRHDHVPPKPPVDEAGEDSDDPHLPRVDHAPSGLDRQVCQGSRFRPARGGGDAHHDHLYDHHPGHNHWCAAVPALDRRHPLPELCGVLARPEPVLHEHVPHHRCWLLLHLLPRSLEQWDASPHCSEAAGHGEALQLRHVVPHLDHPAVPWLPARVVDGEKGDPCRAGNSGVSAGCQHGHGRGACSDT
mmetsp:Transcript_55175/g.124251  ORF Transcript_55175/g.124251 Transcript_55175/m.124251 type:complete len:247 (-) Transcript_55175:55-795(-)